MGDEQTAEAAAVEAEIGRIVRVIEETDTYQRGTLRAYGYKILIETVPGMTRDRWREITGVAPDDQLDPAVQEARRAERARVREEREREYQHELERQRERQAAWRVNRDLLQEYGRPTCCAVCDAPNADRLREELAAGTVGVVPVQAPERTCECDACGEPGCQGDCDQCEDHNCEQCYSDHEVSDCCGYCSECDSHPRDADSPHYNRCRECDHCSECEHYCD